MLFHLYPMKGFSIYAYIMQVLLLVKIIIVTSLFHVLQLASFRLKLAFWRPQFAPYFRHWC